MTSSYEEINKCFHYFVFSLSPEKSVALHVNNLGFILSNCNDALCPVWLKLTQWPLRRSILIVVAAVIGLNHCRYGLKHYPINQLIFVNAFVTICLSSRIANREAHRPLRSAEKQCNSINTFLQSYEHTITLINSVKQPYLFNRIEWFFFCKNLKPFYSRTFCASLVGVNPVVLEKRFLNFVNAFSLFHFYLPL